MKKIGTVILLSMFTFVVAAQKPSTAPTGKSDPVMPIYLVDGVETPYAKVVKMNTFYQNRILMTIQKKL